MDVKAIDIVGVSSGSGTRSCTSHERCGDFVCVNDSVIIKLEVIRNDSTELEEALKVYRLVGTDLRCHIGFLPCRHLNRSTLFNNKRAIIVEDYRTSPSKSKRDRSNRNMGIVKAILMDYIQEYQATRGNTME